MVLSRRHGAARAAASGGPPAVRMTVSRTPSQIPRLGILFPSQAQAGLLIHHISSLSVLCTDLMKWHARLRVARPYSLLPSLSPSCHTDTLARVCTHTHTQSHTSPYPSVFLPPTPRLPLPMHRVRHCRHQSRGRFFKYPESRQLSLPPAAAVPRSCVARRVGYGANRWSRKPPPPQ